MIIAPDEYRFTMTEVVGESNADAMNLRNWMQRETLPIGQKHKLGRWLFSIADIIRVRVVQSLGGLASMPPAEANKLADQVVQRYRDLVTPDEKGRYPLLHLIKPNTTVGRQRLCMTSQGNPMLGTVNSHGVIEFDILGDGRKSTFDELIGGSPHMVIPMEELIARTVMNFTIMAVEEAGEEWHDSELSISKGRTYDPYAEAISVEGFIDWYAKAPPQIDKPTFKSRLMSVDFDAVGAAVSKEMMRGGSE